MCLLMVNHICFGSLYEADDNHTQATISCNPEIFSLQCNLLFIKNTKRKNNPIEN